MSGNKSKNKMYELVAPDGGWGYMICLAVILNMVAISSFVNCFGIVFKELFILLKMDSTSISFFNGLNCIGVAISSFLTSPLLHYMSMRQLGLAAALVFNLGVFGTVFANSQFVFFFCQGFLQSFGHGIIYNLSVTMLNNYFVKRRFLAVSFTQTVTAATAFVTPLFAKWATEMYGFRGTFLLISGISLHSFFAMALMQPVSWHMKKVELPEDKEKETKLLLLNETKHKEDLTASIKTFSKSENAAEGIERNTKIQEKKSMEQGSRLKHVEKFVYQVLDISLFRTFLLSNACIGVALGVFSEMTYAMMLPQALYFMGWSESEVAWAVSLNALGDLVSRILLLFMSNMLAKVGSHEIYIIGLVIAFGSRLGMLSSDNATVINTFMVIMGISRCLILVLNPIVVADSVPPEKFSAAMGLLFLVFGAFNLIVGPVIGAVRDLTDSYTTAFYIITSFFAIVIMFWSIELFYKRSKHKRQRKTVIELKS